MQRKSKAMMVRMVFYQAVGSAASAAPNLHALRKLSAYSITITTGESQIDFQAGAFEHWTKF